MTKRNYTIANIILVLAMVAPLLMFPKLLLLGEATVSEVQARSLNTLPRPDIQAILTGRFQSGIESWLSDQFIASDNLKVIYTQFLNIQNRALTSVNHSDYWRIGDKDVYTYKNGRMLVSKHSNILSPVNLPKLNNLFADISLDRKLFFFFERSSLYDFSQPHIHDECDSIKTQITALKTSCQLIRDYTDATHNFYATDHHWSANGQRIGYEQILKMILPNETPRPVLRQVDTGYIFNGTYARSAATTDFAEPFIVDIYDLPPHDIISHDDGRATKSRAQQILDGEFVATTFTNLYAAFYGGDFTHLIYDYHQTRQPNLLIIGDSYDNAIIERLASHFNQTHAIDLRRYGNLDINAFIRENDIDVLLFAGSYPEIYNAGEIYNIQTETN